MKVTGDPELPLNKGKMCPKGLASIEHLYHPDRLRYPLKRSGKRGAGKWERISRDEALDSIAENIAAIKETDGTKPNVVNVQHGRKFPEEPAPDYGLWKLNASLLTNNAPPYDHAMGTYQLRALLCKIYKADQ